MKFGSTLSLHAEALWYGVKIIGFTPREEEIIRATVSRVPPELLRPAVDQIISDRGMSPKHGRFDPQTKTVRINPETFQLRQRFGAGQGWVQHIEMTMVHEFGHALFGTLTQQQKQEWYDLSGWVKGTRSENAAPYVEKRSGWPEYKSEWTHKKGIRFTRKYAEKNPNEQFADCFAFYLLGKPHQMAPIQRLYLSKLIQERVRKYPRALIEGPTKAYGERSR